LCVGAYFDKLSPLFERLHHDGCGRDCAGNRQLHYAPFSFSSITSMVSAFAVSSPALHFKTEVIFSV
jgi:hypothetical protein